MATKTIVELQVQSNLAEQAGLSKQIKDNLQAAGATRVATPVMAAQQGVMASQPRMAAARPRSEAGIAASDTNLSRGIAGATGAEARDFAKQAQGLGGLVHVYATFAANLFAVSAAFSALRTAADTTNMVKGLDQLGASSGRALGSLSKQIVSVTEGALSLRDAMSATAMASAGGMTSTAILRMSTVAKQASQTLGVSMPDAISRLSRGITKLEPELLDELGILVKVDAANQNYAKSLGKSVNALTDFEKRQGFANAVLEQGEAKFGAIKIDVNPYSKLLASTQNIAQSFLEIVNIPLGFFLGKLADNSLLLAGALAYIGKVLLTQAMPALLAYRSSLLKMTEDSKKVAEASRLAANIQYNEQVDLTRKLDNLAGQAGLEKFKKAKDTQDKIAALQNIKVGKFVGADVQAAISKTNALDLTAQEITLLKERSAKVLSEDTTLHKKRNAGLERYIKEVEAIQADSVHARDAAEQKYISTSTKRDKDIEDSKRKAASLNQRYSLDTIKQATAEIQATEGASAAYKKMFDQLSIARQKGGQPVFTGLDKDGKKITEIVPQISRLTFATEVLAGTFGIAKRGIVDFVSKIEEMSDRIALIGQAVGLAILAFELLDSWLSTAEKEITNYNSSLDISKDATKALVSTSKALENQDLSKWLSPDSMQARANAITGVGDSITDMLKKLRLAADASSWWDNIWDGFLSSSRLQKAASTITKGIKSAVELARPSEAKTVFEAQALSITGATSISDIDKTKLTESQLNQLSASYAIFTSEINKESEKLNAPKQAFQDLKDAMQALNVSMMPTDNISKIGMSFMDLGIKLNAARNSVNNLFQQLARLSKDSSVGLFGRKGTELASESENLQKISDEYVALTYAIEKQTEARAKAAKLLVSGSGQSRGTENLSPMEQQATKNIESLNTSIVALQALQSKNLTKQEENNNKFGSIATYAITKGAELFTQSLNISFAQAALKFSSALAGIITGMGSAEAKAAVAYKDIELRLRSNTIMERLIIEQQKSTLAVMQNTNSLEQETTDAKIKALEASELASDKAQLITEKAKLLQLQATGKGIAEAVILMGKKGSLFNNYVAAAKGTPEQAAGAEMIKGTAMSTAKSRSDAAAIASERATVALNEALGKVAEKYVVINREVSHKAVLLEAEARDTIQLASISNSMMIQQLSNTEAMTVEKQKSKLLDNELLKIEEDHKTKLDAATKASVNLTEAETKSYNDQKLALQQKVAEQNRSNQSAQLSRNIADISKKASIEAYKIEGLRIVQDIQSSKDTAKLDNIKAELEALRSLGGINDILYAQEKGRLDIEILRNNQTKEATTIEATRASALAAAETNNRIQLEIIGKKKGTEVQLDNLRTEAANQLTEAQKRANEIANNSLIISRAKLAVDTQISQRITDNTVLMAKQAEEMLKMVSITTNLATVFGTLGDSVGKTGEAILKMGQDEERYAITKLELTTKTAEARDNAKMDPESYKKALKAEKDADKKNTLSQIGNIAAIAAAGKKMFGEKTLAYKALAGIEKAASIATAAMQAKDLALTMTTAIEKIGINIPAIYSSFMAMMGPFGPPAAAAAIAAFIGAVGGGGGGGGTIDMTGMTASDRQSTQGTGMGWEGNKKGETGGGVFGDAEAKSESIKNSLEILRDTSVEGLSFTNEMVDLLTSIDKGISGVAKGVYGAVGIRTGSQFGTQESSGGSNILGGLFGSSRSTQITDAGIALKGTFTQFMDNVTGIAKGYEDVLTTSTRSFLWSKKTTQTLTRNTQDLDPALAKAISGVFDNAGKLFVIAGGKLGMTVEEVMSSLGDVSVDKLISLRGLKGADLEKELAAVLGSILDDTSTKLFAAMSDFQEFGEGMLQTVMRVTDGLDKVNLAMTSIGKSSIESGIAGMKISESLILAAGGLKEFLDKTKTFADNFLTETERLVPVQAAVNKELNLLGYESNLTKEQIKNVILSFQTIGDTSSTTYVKLLDLSDSINTLEIASAAAIDKLNDFDISIYTELGKAEKALQLTREKELRALEESLRPIQKYLNALKDESTVKAKIATAYKDQSAALKTTVTGLKASIKTLKDYKTSLTMSASSLLTPAEKYAQAKSTMLETAALARKVITASSTAEDIAARDAAVGKLSSTSDAFLTSSREMFASSDRYTQDFASVLEMLDASSNALDAQMSDAEKQQSALDASVSFLDLISTNTDTTATLLAQLLAMQTATELARQGAAAAGSSAAASSLAIPAMASGGMARGLTLVGENGPELANFSSTARVYSNKATNDIFNTKELVAEIRSLRAEVSQLRADQKVQTGHLIAANYDANAKNAEAVAESTDAALADQTWKQRSQVKIA